MSLVNDLREDMRLARLNNPGYGFMFKLLDITKGLFTLFLLATFGLGIWHLIYGLDATDNANRERQYALEQQQQARVAAVVIDTAEPEVGALTPERIEWLRQFAVENRHVLADQGTEVADVADVSDAVTEADLTELQPGGEGQSKIAKVQMPEAIVDQNATVESAEPLPEISVAGDIIPLPVEKELADTPAKQALADNNGPLELDSKGIFDELAKKLQPSLESDAGVVLVDPDGDDAKQSGADTVVAEASTNETLVAEASKAEALLAEVTETEAAKTEAAVAEVAEAEAANTEAAVAEVAEAEAAKTETAVAEVAETEAAETETAVAEVAEAEAAETETAVAEVAESEAAETGAAVAEVAEAETAKTEAVVAEEADAEATETEAVVAEVADAVATETEAVVAEVADAEAAKTEAVVVEVAEAEATETKAAVAEVADAEAAESEAVVAEVADAEAAETEAAEAVKDNGGINEEAWVLAQNAGQYTIQIGSTSNRPFLVRFSKLLPKGQPVAIYYYVFRKRPEYGLSYGLFDSKEESLVALKGLSQQVRRYGAFTRKVGDLHQQITRLKDQVAASRE